MCLWVFVCVSEAGVGVCSSQQGWEKEFSYLQLQTPTLDAMKGNLQIAAWRLPSWFKTQKVLAPTQLKSLQTASQYSYKLQGLQCVEMNFFIVHVCVCNYNTYKLTYKYITLSHFIFMQLLICIFNPQHCNQSDHVTHLSDMLNVIFTVLFTVEMILKLMAFKAKVG